MLTCVETQFSDLDCLRLDNESLSLWVTTSVGPRIIGLALKGESSLFAKLPGLTLDCPGSGVWHLYGGHRLWHAPEDPSRTYLPDDLPIEIERIKDGLHLTQPVEPSTGIQKQINIRLPGADPRVLVEHILHNQGKWPVELAPWAITQLKTGGEAILPFAAPEADRFGVLPNRCLALWPYTDLGSSHMTFGSQTLRVRAEMDNGTFKVGFPDPSGWLAYLLGSTLFVKRAAYLAGAHYFDHGSSSECYCSARFIELESLGPRVTLNPGESTTHLEIWSLFNDICLPEAETEMVAVLGGLGLTTTGDED